MYNYRDQMIRRNLGDLPGMPGDIGGFGGGTWNTDGTQATPQAPQTTQAGVFGRPKRNTGQRIAGYLADALAGAAGQQGPYAAQLAREQFLADQEATYQRRRADEFADWERRHKIEAADARPGVNDTVADYEFIRSTLGDPAARMFLQNRADPPQYRQGPDGQFYRIQTQEAPTQPVGRLTPIPEGGGAGDGTGGFR